jgi:hypothetical protein
MSVADECYVLSGKGLWVGLITRPEESCRVWCVSECGREAPIARRPWSIRGCCATVKHIYKLKEYRTDL